MVLSEQRKKELDAIIAARKTGQTTSAPVGITPERKAQLDAIIAKRKQASAPVVEKPGLMSEIGSDLVKRGGALKEVFTETAQGKINPLQTGLRTVGTVIGGATDVLGRGLVAGTKAITPDIVEQKIGEGVQNIMQTPIGKSGLSAAQAGMEAYQSWKQKNPSIAKDLEATVNIASLFPVEKAFGIAAKGLGEAAVGTGKVAVGTGKVAVGAGEAIAKPVVQAGKAISETGVGRIATDIAERVPRAAQRVSERVGEAAEKSARIKAATPAVQKAIKSNLDERIVNTVAQAERPAAEAYKKMVDIAEQTKTLGIKKRPEIVAGEAAADQYKLIDKQRKAVGAKLGEEVAKLSKLKSVNIADSVSELEGVLSQQGIKFGKKGLDFTGTNFTTQERSRINELYNLATESKTLSPSQVHKKDQLFSKMQREAKFEGLGDIIIDTVDGQKNLFSVFRDVFNSKLDDLSPAIRELNGEYRKWRNIVDDIEGSITKGGKFEAGKGVDVSEYAQTNLRRLLSDAQSAADYREIAKAMDDVARELGYTGAKPEELIAFATELRKIFPETVPATSFAGGVSLGLGDIAKKVLEVGAPNIKDQQRALREMLDEILKTKKLPKGQKGK